jgi:hypothetical protein
VAALSHWLDGNPPESDLVIASEARDLLEANTAAWTGLGVRRTEMQKYPGAEMIDYMKSRLERLADWISSAQ